MGDLAAIFHRRPGGVMTGDAIVALFRHVKGVEIGIVIDGVTVGVFHIHRCAGTVAHQ